MYCYEKNINVWPDKNVSCYVSDMGSSQQPAYHILSGMKLEEQKNEAEKYLIQLPTLFRVSDNLYS